LSAAAIHIGAFLAWAANRGLVASRHQKAMVAAYRRNATLSEYAHTYFHGEFSNSDLTATGVAFADAAYRAYLGSISAVPTLAGYDSTYEIPDTWDTYDAISPMLDDLFAYWRSGREFYP
ncbi:hypothetical protein, partial [Williamsia sp.]|uniref:DUF7832 domain-containing protein n=1 Tax=Williamsia sp. TaxID=1872085 RepID=UPI001A1A4878